MRSDEPPESRVEVASALLWLGGLLSPYVVVSGVPFVIADVWGVGWGVLAGVALPLAWLRTMPTTCMNGGLIWSMLGPLQFALLGSWLLRGALLAAALVI